MDKDEPTFFELVEVYTPPKSQDQAEATRREFLTHFYSEFVNEEQTEASNRKSQRNHSNEFLDSSECGQESPMDLFEGERRQNGSEGEEYGHEQVEEEQNEAEVEEGEEEVSEEEEEDYIEEPVDDDEILKQRGLLNCSGWLKLSTDKCPWSEDLYPYTLPFKYDKMKLNNEESTGKLTVSIVATGLTNLTLVPGNIVYALTKLQLPNRNLKDIRLLSNYPYLQYIDISFNQVTELCSLSNIKYLMVLDASHNRIASIEGYNPPWYLTYLNLSWNRFTEIPDLSMFWSLRHVDMSHNKIKAITGLISLKFLSYLNLSNNEIAELKNLTRMPLKELNLAHNMISTWDENQLTTMHDLKQLNLSFNKLTSLEIIKWNYQLESVNVSFNKISDIVELDCLKTLRGTRHLWMEGNPVAGVGQIRPLIVYLMPQLVCLNGSSLLPAERMSAMGMYSDDIMISTFWKFAINKVMTGPDTSPSQRLYNPANHIIIVVGLPGSYRIPLACKTALKYPQYIKLGKVETTRPHGSIPKDFEQIVKEGFRHVPPNEFSKKREQGKFAAIEHRLGFNLGITFEDMVFEGRVCLLHMELESALEILWMGFNPVLVLAMPTDVSRQVSRLVNLFYDAMSHGKLSETAGELTRESISQTRVVKQPFLMFLSPFYDAELSGSTVPDDQNTEMVYKFDPEVSSLINFFPKECEELDGGSEAGSSIWYQEQGRHHYLRYPTKTFSCDDFGDKANEDEQVEEKSGSCICIKEVKRPPRADTEKTPLTDDELKKQEEEGALQRKYQKSAVLFIKSVLHHREQYITAHINNPGFFLQSIDTEDLEEAANKLGKICLDVYNSIGKDEVNILGGLMNDECYSKIVGERIENMMTELKIKQTTSSEQKCMLDMIIGENRQP